MDRGLLWSQVTEVTRESPMAVLHLPLLSLPWRESGNYNQFGGPSYHWVICGPQGLQGGIQGNYADGFLYKSFLQGTEWWEIYFLQPVAFFIETSYILPTWPTLASSALVMWRSSSWAVPSFLPVTFPFPRSPLHIWRLRLPVRLYMLPHYTPATSTHQDLEYWEVLALDYKEKQRKVSLPRSQKLWDNKSWWCCRSREFSLNDSLVFRMKENC